MLDIIGHDNTKKQIEEAAYAAIKRNLSLPHMLFSGAAGCGKTSIARYVSKITDAPFLSVVPNDLRTYEDVMKVLDQLDHTGYDDTGNRTGKINPTILFFDEVHNLPLKGQELIGLAMERFIIEAGKPNKYYWIPFFTIIGATTLSGKLSKPFRDRFKLLFNFQPYNITDMNKIVLRHFERLGIKATEEAIQDIANRSRGTPRVAVGFVERVCDKLLAIESTVATKQVVKSTFDQMNIDEEGFTSLEIRILESLLDAGSPIGLDNLSTILQEDSKSIRDFGEPYLVRKGLIVINSKGRMITEKGKQHLRQSNKGAIFIKKEIDFNYVRL